ncbi:MAG: hypothetical protein GXO97_04060 [Nitrospirae bacterium]|nr:hypothetical protein [Nitrospirota bacterium]
MKSLRVYVAGILLLSLLIMGVLPPLVVLSHRDGTSVVHGGKHYLTIDVCSPVKGDLVNDFGGFITISLFVLTVIYSLFFFIRPSVKRFASLNNPPLLRPPEAFL